MNHRTSQSASAPIGHQKAGGFSPMADINIAFCRTLLAGVHRDVKEFDSDINLRRDAWVWCAGRDLWEFHGPKDFYWYGNADNAYDARAKGWMAWLRARGAEGYALEMDD